MVYINIWYIPRSRSTVLTKCLSQISNCKVFFEPFLWASFLGDEDSAATNNPGSIPEAIKEHVVPGFNYKSVLKQFREYDAKVTILKDFIYNFDGRYEEIIDKDSLNVLLYSDPKYVLSSYLKECNQYVHEVLKEFIPDLTVSYTSMLECIEYVSQNCSKIPIIVDASILCSKEGSRTVVEKICDTAGVDFCESYLTWPATEGGFSSEWFVPRANQTFSIEMGFFTRANKSTGFEDLPEREVELEKLAKTHPTLVEDIKLCEPFYKKIVSLPFNVESA